MAIDIVIILFLTGLVQVTVEIKEVTPSLSDIVEVSVRLFSHIDKMLTGHGVVKHGSSFNFLVHLSSKEGSFFFQIINLSRRVGQHESECPLSVLERLHSIVYLIRRAAPLRHILSFEQSFLVL